MTEAAQNNWDDRRREPRVPASGSVVLTSGQTARRVIFGQLVDRSNQGFRLIHNDTDLEAGERVEFSMDDCSGVALVVWRRIHDHSIECGFMIEHSP